MESLNLLGRNNTLFRDDLKNNEIEMLDIVKSSKFLIIGGAGTIGQAVTKEIFKRNPKSLHVIDISENNLVELVRDIRSTLGYIKGDFKTFAIDVDSEEFLAMVNTSLSYDYVLNLSALKHVRSEKDPFTLMRLIKVNIINVIKSLQIFDSNNLKKYFCVSSDKATNPVNLMGASKLIMEMFVMRESVNFSCSTARFANVAFSDGSLLQGFNNRIEKRQPISAPNDVKRYFITAQESGELCLLSTLLGKNRDIFFPKLNENLKLISFSDIAKSYVESKGYEVYCCEDEEEARRNSIFLINKKKWPCYFFRSDTTGEKDFEEFYSFDDKIDIDTFKDIGIIENKYENNIDILNEFEISINLLLKKGSWNKKDLVKLFIDLLGKKLNYKDVGKYLDSKM